LSAAELTTCVTILGSGTCVPSLKRSSCSVLIETGNSKLLLDAGPGTMRRLMEAGVSIFELSHLFFSHFHPDHTSELVPLLFATKYPDETQRKDRLTVLADRAFKLFFIKLTDVYGEWIVLPPDKFQIIPLDPRDSRGRSFDDFTVTCQTVAHREESLAYRITDAAGKSIVYSGDTDISENLVVLANGADLLICESALPDELKSPGHLTPSLAGDIAARANVKHLVLTHFYPECETVDLVSQCQKTYDGPITLAEDLMTIDL
jgi:ribonuclease BN (tRNA processing enzyme)